MWRRSLTVGPMFQSCSIVRCGEFAGLTFAFNRMSLSSLLRCCILVRTNLLPWNPSFKRKLKRAALWNQQKPVRVSLLHVLIPQGKKLAQAFITQHKSSPEQGAEHDGKQNLEQSLSGAYMSRYGTT